MLKIDPNPRFTRTVTAMVPVDGGHEKQEFKATFKALTVTELAAFDLYTEDGTTTFLKTVVVGLGDIVGADEKPAPYSDDLRDTVIAMPWSRAGLVEEYFKGIGKARSGN